MRVDPKRALARLKRHAHLVISLSVALVFAVVTTIIEADVWEYGLLSKKGLIHLLDLKSLDVKVQSREGGDLPEPQVVIAAIDEKGIDRYGLWPWSRSVLAQFIAKATAGGAKVIAFDAVFGDEDRNASWVTLKRFAEAYEAAGLAPGSPLARELGESVKAAAAAHEAARRERVQLERASRGPARSEPAGARRETDRTAAELRRAAGALAQVTERSTKLYESLHAEVAAASPDDALAAAIAASPQTILGYFVFYDPKDFSGVSAARAVEGVSLLAPSAVTQIYDHLYQEVGGQEVEIFAPIDGADLTQVQVASMAGALPPLEKFAKVARAFGYYNALPDPDGQMRRVRLLNRFGPSLYPALSLVAAARFHDAEIRPLSSPLRPRRALDGIAPLSPGGEQVMTSMHGHLILNYYTDPRRYFPTYSVADIIDGTVPPSAYQGKVVLFGMTALGLYDFRPTPFEPATPGVYIHATAIQNMIDGRYLNRPFGIALIEAAAYLVLGLLLGLLLPRVPAWAGFLATLLFVAVLYVVDLKVIFPRGYWLMNVLPALQSFLTFLAINVYGFLTEGREKRMIRKAFQFYLSKNVVDEVLKDPTKLKLGGEKKVCTVLFSDVRGFTSISERLSPEALVSLLNSYLTPMTDIVLKYEGTLDKYIGDAIMAIFGAPVSYADHATRACRVCLEMLEELHRLQVGWREQGFPEIDIGIGLNTGPVSAGNMGSLQRFDYTVMGDNVNLASRLEGINKQYGTNIIVSDSTFEAAKAEVYGREIDLVRVKGKREPVKIYELLGLGTPSQAHADLIGEFHRALGLYRGQQWDAATAAFAGIREKLKPDDHAAELYLERCRAMRDGPPGADWDGVTVMTTK